MIEYLTKEYAEKELQNAKHLFTHESRYNDEQDFCHYSKIEYFLTFQKKILVKYKSSVADMHSLFNGHGSEYYYYTTFESLNNYIRQYSFPEWNKYLGISEENCEQFF